MTHVVWDWNGTLLDDMDLLVRATNVSLDAVGVARIDAEQYRQHHVRPLSVFYERLAQRELTDEEWNLINHGFHNSYASMLHEAALAGDAIRALNLVAESHATQSILSMWVHGPLNEIVRQHGIYDYFVRVDGLPEPGVENKAKSLTRHLDAIGESGGASMATLDTVLIGDTADDGNAATDVGIRSVLVTSGGQHRSELEATGWPVVDTLTAAVGLI